MVVSQEKQKDYITSAGIVQSFPRNQKKQKSSSREQLLHCLTKEEI